MNWLLAGGYILSAVLTCAGVTGYYIERDNYLGAKSALSDEQAQEAKNVAAAKQAVIDAAAKDAAATNKLVTQLQVDNAALQKEAADAQVSLATAPVVTVTKGCPDIMAAPVVRQFLGSLPN